jgi:hypothetical protein
VSHSSSYPIGLDRAFTGMTVTPDPKRDQLTETRHRELAIEHLLFQTIRELARDKPDLLDRLEASVSHLWDYGPKETRDDEAVREVARTFIKSLRS